MLAAKDKGICIRIQGIKYDCALCISRTSVSMQYTREIYKITFSHGKVLTSPHECFQTLKRAINDLISNQLNIQYGVLFI